MLFLARDGVYYSIKDVRSARPIWQQQIFEIDLGHRSVTVDWHAWERVKETTIMSMSSSLPGYFLLTECEEENGSISYEKEPVVAWGLTLGGTVIAVTVDGIDDMNRAVLLPDGGVAEPQAGSYRNLEAYLREQAATLSSAA